MKIQLINYGLNYKLQRSHYNDAGLDVSTQEDVEIQLGSSKSIRLGFGIKLPDSTMGLIFPRSGMSSNGLTCELPPIDSGYTGEIHAIVSLQQHVNVEKLIAKGLKKTDKKDVLVIPAGTRVGQLVIMPIMIPDFVEDLGEERGANGFGSTGSKSNKE